MLQRLKRARTLAVRKQLLKNGDRKFIIAIIEIISNILHDSVPLKPAQKSRLSKRANILRKLAAIRSEKQARKELVQRGGSIIPLLVGPILSALATLVLE